MRILFLGILVFSVILMCGCETTKNSLVGTALIGQGVVDDTTDTYNTLEKADDKFEKEYW
jgi:hypothetical protein